MLQIVVDAYLSMMHLTDEECLKPNQDSIPSDDNWRLRVEVDYEQSSCYTENETKDESKMTWLPNPNCTNLMPFVPDEHDVQQPQPRRTKLGRRPSLNVQHYWWGEFLRRTYLQEILLQFVKSLEISIKKNSLFHHWNTWGWLPIRCFRFPRCSLIVTGLSSTVGATTFSQTVNGSAMRRQNVPSETKICSPVAFRKSHWIKEILMPHPIRTTPFWKTMHAMRFLKSPKIWISTSWYNTFLSYFLYSVKQCIIFI